MKRPDPVRISLAAAEALSLEELVEAVELQLKRMIGASGLVLYRHRGDGALQGIAGDLAQVLPGYHPGFAPDDPTQRLARTLPARPRVVLATRGVSTAELGRSAAYADFYRRHRMERLACLWLTDRPYASPGMLGLLLARPRSREDFGCEEETLLQATLPALTIAVRRCERVEQLRRPELPLPEETPAPRSAHPGQRLRVQFGLTPAEARVLRLIALGLTNAAIAERCAVSLETVRTHVKNVLGKLGVETRAQAAVRVWSAQEDD